MPVRGLRRGPRRVAGPLRHQQRRISAARTVELRKAIAEAEATLATLKAAIGLARSEAGAHALCMALEENQRLLDANSAANDQARHAVEALECAVKASRTDALTGLRNRSGLWDLLAHDMDLAKRNGSFLAVYLFDVDEFKGVNDRLGHAVGDRLLQHIAKLLRATVRKSDLVCRFGGDEFVVICHRSQPGDLASMTTKLKCALATPMTVGTGTLPFSVSVGVSVFPGDAETPSALAQAADERMYESKRQGLVRIERT